MKHRLYAIAIMVVSSTPLFSQTPGSASTQSTVASDQEIGLAIAEENSSMIPKDDHDGFFAGLTLTITPNPTFGNTMLILSTELPTQVQIRLLDSGFDLVQILFSTQLSAGTNHIASNFSELTPGIYYVLAITPTGGALKKMLVM